MAVAGLLVTKLAWSRRWGFFGGPAATVFGFAAALDWTAMGMENTATATVTIAAKARGKANKLRAVVSS